MHGVHNHRAAFGVYCENDKGKKIIARMKLCEQQYYKNYRHFAIAQQIPVLMTELCRDALQASAKCKGNLTIAAPFAIAPQIPVL